MLNLQELVNDCYKVYLLLVKNLEIRKTIVWPKFYCKIGLHKQTFKFEYLRNLGPGIAVTVNLTNKCFFKHLYLMDFSNGELA